MSFRKFKAESNNELSTWKLKDICSKIGSGSTPRGGESAYLDERIEYAFVRSQNVFDFKFDSSEVRFISDNDAQKLKGVHLQKDDILLNITGDGVTFSRCCIVDENILPAAVNQHVSIIRVNQDICLPGYLLAFLCLPETKAYIASFNAGGSRRAITKGHIESFEIPAISIQKQKVIQDFVLSVIEKIEVNSLINQTLEQMAQAIFKSWFVDFDPVKAKMNGEQPEGMDAATASLFPEKLVESELGLIPDGWEVKPFSEWVKITKGKNITKKTIVDGDVPVVAGGLKPAYFHNAHNVDGPAITISASGANAGYVNLYFENIWASDCSYISQSTTPLFFLQYVALRYNQKKIFDMQTGAAQPHIYPRDFERLMIVVPNEELCRKLEEVFASFFRTVANNKQQNIDLAALRDTLLPKLLSGEIELEPQEAKGE
ncbi:restriction endonuclease subunit S [Vibrio diabolicus]|uniref:restriction endonuclease subunit S n=1 Tax=Vibrio diabolicus TaxID=50719 RepID=UPI0035A962FA